MTTWHNGPPPSMGWWPTRVVSTNRHGPSFLVVGLLRWYDGRQWSGGVSTAGSARYAAIMAKTRAAWPDKRIQWTDRTADWPERSRT